MSNWNLDDLYQGFNEKYLKDIETLKEQMLSFQQLVSQMQAMKPVAFLEAYLTSQEETTKLARSLSAFASLTMSTDVTNQEALGYLSKLQQIYSSVTKENVMVSRYIATLDLQELSNHSEIIKTYLFQLNEEKESARHLLSEKEEVLYAKLRPLSSGSWSQLQGLLTSNLNVKMGDKEITLSEVRNLAYDNDKDIRKNAYEAELKAYEQIDDAVALALSNIKREVTEMNTLRGYDSALEKTLISSRMQKETLDAMIDAMKDYRQHFERYLKAKATYLGYENGLPFYELFAPVGKLDKNYTYEEAKAIVNESFYGFSKRLGDFSTRAFNENWIDVYPKKGKRGGAFCSNQQQIKQSRILTNFTGSLSDVSTIAHELGHGYHGDVISDEKPLNWGYPMPLAETASIFCETIVTNNLLSKLSNDDEILSVLEIALQGDTQVIIDILSRYFFETKLFENSTGPISKNQMKTWMVEAQKEAYLEGLDHENLHPYMWLNKGHYYSAGLNFYNFPYAFGLLFGKGLYAKYLENKDDFLRNYDKLLMLTGKASVEDVAMSMGIDVKDKSFWHQSLNEVVKDIDKVISLFQKK
ncbi:Peptidase M3B, oligoendopeptidase F [Paracholeplasma brassicae]|uniref:Peptidase M3B, oligoendopeptidase F n=1 Tax=Acholeplasma brassicae TaxID=61635 RepID=U4KPL2_9MOLU|nr:M3 family oligoendopeptidase [Paracholeplasma brassicae]CCV66291.1 Peptidase M3B, oligoendopeptidase F [Paracholeplasma brassicae]